MNVSLTPELEELINQKVMSGMYTSASEVVREGLRLLREHDELKRIRTEELRRDILVGVAESKRSESKPLDVDAVKAEGRHRKRAAQAAERVCK